MRRRRAVLLILPATNQTGQQVALLEWATQHRYDVGAVTYVPEAAAALAEDGLVDVVVLYRHTRATLEMAGRVGQTAAVVDELKPGHRPLHNGDGTRTRILDAAARGVPADAIALVLDIPLATVHEALGILNVRPIRPGTGHNRRPRILTAPPGRP